MPGQWFRVRAPLSRRLRILLAVFSFLLPLAVWSAVSYVPFIWHPDMLISNPGDVDYLMPGMRVKKATFALEIANAKANHAAPPQGIPCNPVYLPAPGEVLKAFYTSFTTPPRDQNGLWLHQSLWQSIQTIFWGFVISSLIGVPLGILCGSHSGVAKLVEPFIEFFRYLPAPAFGTLAVAVLGIYAGPKIAIIVIGTLFQQILIIANTTRKADFALVEAALTLGTRNLRLLTSVIIPSVLPDLYRDQRILLGWAWTYLIVAELIGATSGISLFITQQSRYQHYANVYAAIAMIGILGLGTDLVLAALGRKLFPWDKAAA
ncbi:ABC transporter permease [Acidocella sp.]|uniref:ABC transporter permease n=1 Tax=Acidocella sp. TaxID=50710 RepID=UPI0038D11D0B